MGRSRRGSRSPDGWRRRRRPRRRPRLPRYRGSEPRKATTSSAALGHHARAWSSVPGQRPNAERTARRAMRTTSSPRLATTRRRTGRFLERRSDDDDAWRQDDTSRQGRQRRHGDLNRPPTGTAGKPTLAQPSLDGASRDAEASCCLSWSDQVIHENGLSRLSHSMSTGARCARARAGQSATVGSSTRVSRLALLEERPQALPAPRRLTRWRAMTRAVCQRVEACGRPRTSRMIDLAALAAVGPAARRSATADVHRVDRAHRRLRRPRG